MDVYLGGEFVPREQARVPVEDRGFLFGDGVYEVLRARGGGFFEEERHWNRLDRSLAELSLRLPDGVDRRALRALCLELLHRNHLGDGEAIVYLQITRGAAPRTHHFPPPDTAPTLYVSTTPFQTPWDTRRTGVAAITCPDLRWARCDIKSINLLPNTLAKQRARDAGVYEAVLVRDGAITEGASTSVLAVIDGALHVHPDGHPVLPGVTCAVVLELAARLGLRVERRPVPLSERAAFEELMLASTTSDVLPIVSLDGAPIAAGRPGSVTRSLQHAFYRHMGVTPPVALD